MNIRGPAGSISRTWQLIDVGAGVVRTRAVLNLGAQACPPQVCTGAVFAKRDPDAQAEAESSI